MALSAQEYTIQAISALKESSITPAFEKKIEKTGIPYIKKEEGDRHVVLLGSYKKTADTRHDVIKVRKGVAHDAFVRPMERGEVSRVTPQHSSGQKLNGSAQEKHAVSTASVVANPNEQGVAVVAVSSVVLNHDANITGQTKEAAACPQTIPSATGSDVVLVYDRNAIRKYDISEAIEYYKKSPYYSFKSTTGGR